MSHGLGRVSKWLTSMLVKTIRACCPWSILRWCSLPPSHYPHRLNGIWVCLFGWVPFVSWAERELKGPPPFFGFFFRGGGGVWCPQKNRGAPPTKRRGKVPSSPCARPGKPRPAEASAGEAEAVSGRPTQIPPLCWGDHVNLLLRKEAGTMKIEVFPRIGDTLGKKEEKTHKPPQTRSEQMGGSQNRGLLYAFC